MTRIISFLIIITFLIGCSGRPGDKRLLSISESIDEDPRQAIVSLDSIDRDRLPESDGHFLDLLRIKARDKAYVTHTSDSLILSVVDYYADHKDSGLYPEALYYAGRVYSDMGDFPTALEYFHAALDETPEKERHTKSYGNMLSQTGRLLHTMRMNSQAIPYLEEDLKLSEELGDSASLPFSHQLLGAVYMRQKEYEKAEMHFMKAFHCAKNFPDEDRALMQAYIAAIKYEKSKPDSALTFIREAMLHTDSLTINFALAHAARIYLANNITDTAYMYARKLASCGNPVYEKHGLKILLTHDDAYNLPSDSIKDYLVRYEKAVDKVFDRYDSEEIIMRNSVYNYDSHLRKRVKAEQALNMALVGIAAGVFILLLVAVLYFYQKYKYNRKQLELINKIRSLETTVSVITADKQMKEHAAAENDAHMANEEVAVAEISVKRNDDNLREELKSKMKSVYDAFHGEVPVDPSILNSEIFAVITDLIQNGRCMTDEIWDRLHDTIEKYSPLFFSRLQILTGCIDFNEVRLAMLLKCGIRPTDIATLLCKTKGAITYQRKVLCRKLFGEDVSVAYSDSILRIL